MAEPWPIWAAARKRIRDQAFGQIVGGLVLSLTISAIDCGMLPEGEKCNVRTPIITAVVLTVYLLGVVLWNWIIKAPRDIALAALKRAEEADASRASHAERAEIHAALAALVQSGESVAVGAEVELTMYQRGVQRQDPNPGVPHDYHHRWSEWTDQVADLLIRMDGGGRSFVSLFNGLEFPRPINLSAAQRTPADIQAIRIQKDWLRELAERYRP